MANNNPIADTPQDARRQAPVFAARLTPHRSLPRQGFVLLMLLIVGLAGSSAVMFMAMGAWPVMLFLLLDIVIIFLAFQLSYRAGKQYEEVVLTSDNLTITRVSAWGRIKTETLQPFWTRLKTAYDHEEERVLAVKLESKGRQVTVGAFLNPDDKESFANALGEALTRVKSGRLA